MAGEYSGQKGIISAQWERIKQLLQSTSVSRRMKIWSWISSVSKSTKMLNVKYKCTKSIK